MSSTERLFHALEYEDIRIDSETDREYHSGDRGKREGDSRDFHECH